MRTLLLYVVGIGLVFLSTCFIRDKKSPYRFSSIVLVCIGLSLILASLVVSFMDFGLFGFVWIVVAVQGLILTYYKIIKPRLSNDNLPSSYTASEVDDLKTNLKQHIGKSGKVVSVLRPIGKVEIDGKRIEAMAYSVTVIPQGTQVVVVDVKQGRALVVRPLEKTDDQ